MRHPITLGLLALFTGQLLPTAAIADPPPSPPIAAPAGSLVLRRQMVSDPYPKMDAYSILAPEGWKVDSNFDWVPGNAGGPHVNIMVSNAAEKAAVRLYPSLTFFDGVRENEKRLAMKMDPSGRRWASMEHQFDEGSPNTPGTEIRELPKSPKDYVLNILIPKFRPALAAAKDLTVVSDTDLPDYAKALAAASPLKNVKFTASRIRITYSVAVGPMEEEFICIISSAPVGQAPRASTMWIGNATSGWAPKGKLDALLPTLNAVAVSRQMQLPYFNFAVQIGEMINQRWNAKLQDMSRNETERIRIYGEMQRQAQTEASQKIRDRFKEQQDAKAAGQEHFMQYITDTSAYTNPSDGSKLALPANYKFNYISNHGDVIQTDNANFDPPIDPSTSWNKLEKSH